MTDVSISLPAKRRRGRPRKDGNLSRQGNLQSPENPTHTNNTQRAGTIYPTPDGLKNNTHQELNTNPKDATTTDDMVGSTIYGVIEGSFDAGYLISVRIANNDTPFRGVVFQPKKFIPIRPANDVAPQATMYQRREITVPFSSGFSPRPPQKAVMQSVPASKQTVLRPVLPLSVTPYFSNQSAFMLPDAMMLRTSSFPQLGGKITTPKAGANQQSAPVHPTDEVMQAFNQKSQVHELQEPQDIKIDLHPSDLRGPDVSFHHDQSQPEFHQSDLVDDRVSKSPNLKLDLSSSVHEMKSPNLGYHQALVAGNPLLLPPEFTGEPLEFMLEKNTKSTRQERSTESGGVSSPSGPYKLELAAPQSTVNTRSAACITDMDFVLSDVVQPTEYHQRQGHFSSETKHR